MIAETDVYKIGVINKPHGIQGELLFTFTDDIFDRVNADYLICMMDGILVPFFIESYRFRSGYSALVKFERIDTIEQAQRFTNAEVFFPIALQDDDESDCLPSWDFLIGFGVQDVQHGDLGKIVAVDDSTLNVLFCIEDPQGKEILMPAHEEFIKKVDKRKRRLTVQLPEGLMEI